MVIVLPFVHDVFTNSCTHDENIMHWKQGLLDTPPKNIQLKINTVVFNMFRSREVLTLYRRGF